MFCLKRGRIFSAFATFSWCGIRWRRKKLYWRSEAAFFRLQDNPKLGADVEGRPGDRQLFIPFGNSAYVLRCRLDEARDILIVVRIWHGRESRD
ncbi:type II toxin-antitoxin system RelE/ParE family toxin [Rhizobium sp. SL86]|uniref:type II toxin-antitoxin system RelE/ParE family toxin n=1 Tax=Rhizobium sp. SL86 TaxID=2995148 RepID=UPI003FA3626E